MSARVTIERLLARGPEPLEPLATRLRLSHLLGTADLKPRGLAPQEVFLVRRLRAPQPLSLEGVRVPGAWERAVQAELEQLYQTAVRPRANYPVLTPSDESLCFPEQAELLAFLGALVVQSQPEALWVWQSIAQTSAPPEPALLVRLWQQEPRSIPTALGHLIRWQLALPFLQSLSASQTESLLAAVLQAFSLSLPPQEPTRLEPHETRRHEPAGEDSLAPRTHVPFQIPGEAPPAVLSGAARHLLMVAQVLESTPSLAAAKRELASLLLSPPTLTGSHEPQEAARPELLLHPVDPAQPPASPLKSPTAPAFIEHSALPVPEPVRGQQRRLSEGVVTSLGGVFYLIPFVLDQLAQSEEEFPAFFWQTLEHFARGLLDEDFSEDALWVLLAELDGREREHFSPSGSFDQWQERLAERLQRETFQEVLAVPARVFVTRLHLDVVFPLERISLPVRLAGLDQSPGWVPELTRVITFHFE